MGVSLKNESGFKEKIHASSQPYQGSAERLNQNGG